MPRYANLRKSDQVESLVVGGSNPPLGTLADVLQSGRGARLKIGMLWVRIPPSVPSWARYVLTLRELSPAVRQEDNRELVVKQPPSYSS